MLVDGASDAMRRWGRIPTASWMVPRVLASLLMLPLLTAIMASSDCWEAGRFRFVPAAKRDRVLEARH